MRYYKVVGENNQSLHNPDFSYKIGEWTLECKVDICHSGYHVTDAIGLINFMKIHGAKKIYEVETRGEMQEIHDDMWGGGKYAFASIRLVREVPWRGSALLDALNDVRDFFAKRRKAAETAYTNSMCLAMREACEQVERAFDVDEPR